MRQKLLRERKAYLAEWVDLTDFVSLSLKEMGGVKAYTKANQRRLIIMNTIKLIDEALGMSI